MLVDELLDRGVGRAADKLAPGDIHPSDSRPQIARRAFRLDEDERKRTSGILVTPARRAGTRSARRRSRRIAPFRSGEAGPRRRRGSRAPAFLFAYSAIAGAAGRRRRAGVAPIGQVTVCLRRRAADVRGCRLRARANCDRRRRTSRQLGERHTPAWCGRTAGSRAGASSSRTRTLIPMRDEQLLRRRARSSDAAP